MKLKNLLLIGLLATGLSTAALAAGFYTNGLPPVTPGSSYWAPNGQTNAIGTPLSTYASELGGFELIPVETGATNGSAPQTVAATSFQLGALAAVINSNAATATSGAATLNTSYGVVTSEALTTAAGSSYTLTLTDSTVAATSKVQAAAYLGAGTTGALQVVSVTPAAGSVVIVVKNIGTAALNAAIKIPFQVF